MNNAALILIDIQKGLDEQDYYGGNRNNPGAEQKAADLLSTWRKLQWPIFHVKHNSQNANSPLRAGRPGNEIKEIVKPLAHEPVIEKEVNSAFVGTNLKQLLDDSGIKDLVIVGLTTNHCVSTTVRMAGNLGYNVWLASDATACFNRQGVDGKIYPSHLVHEITLASLHDEFAIVISTAEILNRIKSIPETIDNNVK